MAQSCSATGFAQAFEIAKAGMQQFDLPRDMDLFDSKLTHVALDRRQRA